MSLSRDALAKVDRAKASGLSHKLMLDCGLSLDSRGLQEMH